MPALPHDLYNDIIQLLEPHFRLEEDRDAILLPVLSSWGGFSQLDWNGSAFTFTSRLVYRLPSHELKLVLQSLRVGHEEVNRAVSLCQYIDEILETPVSQALGGFHDDTTITPEKSVIAPSTKQPFELLMPYQFDLRHQCAKILDNLPRFGLVGYGVAHSSPDFLRYLLDRLRQDLSPRALLCHPRILRVDEVRMPRSIVIQTIKMAAKNNLPVQNVVFVIDGLRSESQISMFWDGIKNALSDIEMSHALVMIIAYDEEVVLPKGVFSLPSPEFGKADVWEWVKGIVNELGWPSSIIEVWHDTIWNCACNNDTLVIDWVYDHLEFMSKELPRITSLEQWEHALQTWSQRYA